MHPAIHDPHPEIHGEDRGASANQAAPRNQARPLHRRIPLTLKMIIVSILVGLAVWGVLDNIQSRKLKTMFQAQLTGKLNQQSMKDRISFDRYVKTHLQSVKLFVSQKKFHDYIKRTEWAAEEPSVVYHTRPPVWFPKLSVLRTFAQPRYAILLGPAGKAREVYKSHADNPPPSLLHPSPLLLAKSIGQNFITRIDGAPYLLSSKSFSDRGNRRATLMLASPIDDEFLTASLGTSTSGHIVALLTADKSPRIMMSSNIEEITPGTSLESLRENFFIIGQEFFDYGAAEEIIKFASLVSTREVDSMTQSVLSRGRQERLVTALVFIASFTLVMFWVTRRIQQLTLHISHFSQRVFGSKAERYPRGDQLYVLEDRFHRLTDEVLLARDVIRKESEERLRLEKKSMEAEQNEKQLTLLQSVTQAVGIGVFADTGEGPASMNRQMDRFAEMCGGLENFDTESSAGEERTLLDAYGEKHIFHISSPDIFDDSAISLVRDVTKDKEQTEALEHLAMHDSLTGLPNRALLRDRLQQAIFIGQRDREQAALLMMDLDRFKEINDTLGHHVGDMMLQEAGARLPSALRKSDTVARLGGDEFAVVLPSTSLEHAEQIAGKLLELLKSPFQIEGHSLYVGVSIGIACYPDHGEDTNTLLQRADVAMYVAKNSQSGISVYNPEHDQHSLENLILMNDLRQAIEEGGLSLHYQPKIDCASGGFRGVEALVRWNHPDHGFIPPDLFIPIAEHTGLVKPLTMWVLNMALHQCTQWLKSEDALDVKVSVNLSVRNLLDMSFPDEVNSYLKKWDIDPRMLELEITESAVMEDPDSAMKILMQLDKLGVQLSIDDFGTGYTSLAYLKRLPVDIIKIDKSFVMNMIADASDTTIVRSTIDLAHNLGMRVVAEGVESEEILNSLTRLGCDSAQGYHICRPVPAEEFSSWLQEYQGKSQTVAKQP